MRDATLTLARPDKKSTFHVTAVEATADTGRNDVVVPGVAKVTSDDGLRGTLAQVESDMASGLTTAKGPVHLTFSDGTTLDAANMVHDGNAGLWTFENATVMVQDLPAATADASSFDLDPEQGQ